MFEKETKEYGNSFSWTNDDRIIDYSEQGFQKGAEFGYNKCFEHIKKLVDEHTRLDCIIPELLKLKETEK